MSERRRLVELGYLLIGCVVPIVFGYHALLRVDRWTFGNQYASVDLAGLVVFVFAGIGSFDQFVDSIVQSGASVLGTFEYPDHCMYTLEDVMDIMHAVKKKKGSVIVTTAKDWVKIHPLIQQAEHDGIQWLIVHVEFKGVSEADEQILLRVIRQSIFSSYISVKK